MASSASPTRSRSLSWQEKLQDHCRSNQIHPPIFNIVSDRRGGRTAWSSTVTVTTPNSPAQQTVQARFWYDGTYINNAKEDAAEVALRLLTGGGGASSPTSPASASSTSSIGWGRGSGPSGGSAIGGAGIGATWPRSPPATGRW